MIDHEKTGTAQSASGPPDPAAALQVVLAVHRLLRFHLDLGLDRYPASEPLRAFLGPRAGSRSGPVRGPGAPSGRRAAEPAAEDAGTRLPPAVALRNLESEVEACTLCSLAGKRGERSCVSGGESPGLLVVGDWTVHLDHGGDRLFGPGEDEMLARMMAAIGLAPGDYRVTNVLKCSPGGGQPPPDAARACRSWLAREIAILRPGLVCAMGELAAQVLTGSSQPLARSHGRFQDCRCGGEWPVQVLPTYHPRLLLRQPELKQVAWQDLQKVARYLARTGDRGRVPVAVPGHRDP